MPDQMNSPQPRDLGLNFPAVDGVRSSTTSAKLVLAAAARSVDEQFARRIEDDAGDWRMVYPGVFEELTRVEAVSNDGGLTVAADGLRAAYDHFVFVTEEGERPLDGVGAGGVELETERISGSAAPAGQLTVPYGGELLHGSALLHRLDDWVTRGITEPSFAVAVGEVVRHPEWLDLRDRTFALVGAGAAMGPFAQLMRWGATVAAVDLPRPEVWQRLASVAESSPGSMLMPVRRGSSASTGAAGANLLTEVGAVSQWLATVPGPVTIGNYGYADGALFVRLSMAFELLVRQLSERRDDLSIAYLATPSDVFLVPEDAVDMARGRRRRVTPGYLAARFVHLASRGEYFKENYGDLLDTPHGRYGLVNAFIVEQGQNYALAKRLQRWRMLRSRAEGLVTSVHVAPPSRTESVHKNPTMAQRQRLGTRIGLEAFDAATSQALGAAMLVHDLRNPASPANPEVDLRHPHEAFMFAANPGGRWRAPFDASSSLPVLRRLDRLPLLGVADRHWPVPTRSTWSRPRSGTSAHDPRAVDGSRVHGVRGDAERAELHDKVLANPTNPQLVVEYATRLG